MLQPDSGEGSRPGEGDRIPAFPGRGALGLDRMSRLPTPQREGVLPAPAFRKHGTAAGMGGRLSAPAARVRRTPVPDGRKAPDPGDTGQPPPVPKDERPPTPAGRRLLAPGRRKAQWPPEAGASLPPAVKWVPASVNAAPCRILPPAPEVSIPDEPVAGRGNPAVRLDGGCRYPAGDDTPGHSGLEGRECEDWTVPDPSGTGLC